MNHSTFMDKLRSFLGFRQEPLRNDFRNPIMGSDDDDDGDELYSRQHNIKPEMDSFEAHMHFAKQVHDMFQSFGSMFGDVKLFFNDGDESFDSMAGFADIPGRHDYESTSNIRDYYLKPGYQNKKQEQIEDMDLDGKISSNDISNLLKTKDEGPQSVITFDGNMVTGRPFCQTIITTSVTKPDGTVETKRIVKNGNEVIEETTTSTIQNTRNPLNSSMDHISTAGMVYSNMFSELSSMFRNFY